MKVAVIVLLAAVGVCSAAFSGSLLEKTRPLLNQAGLRASMATSALTRSDKNFDGLGDLLTGMINNAIGQATQLIEQIQQQAGQLSLLWKARIQAAIVGIRAVLGQISENASGVLLVAKQQLLALVLRLEALLNGSGSGAVVAGSRGLLDDLLAQLNLDSLLSGGLSGMLEQLFNSEFVQGLIEQFLPFIDQAGDIAQQIAALLLGQAQLGRVAPRGLSEMIAHFQTIIQAIHAAAGDAIEAAHQLVADFIANGSGNSVNQAVQAILSQIHSIALLLPASISQPLIEAIQSLLN